MKTDLKNVNLLTIKFNLDIPEELIAKRATEIYEESGRIEGRDKENWAQAIEEIKEHWYRQVQRSLFHDERNINGRFVPKGHGVSKKTIAQIIQKPVNIQPRHNNSQPCVSPNVIKFERQDELEFATNLPDGVSHTTIGITYNGPDELGSMNGMIPKLDLGNVS